MTVLGWMPWSGPLPAHRFNPSLRGGVADAAIQLDGLTV
jgi:hypothetical protein